MMNFIRFIFFKIYSFYNRYWPSYHPEVYAFCGTAALITFNFISIHFLYILLIGTSTQINPYVAIVFLILSLLICYLIIFKNKNYQKILKTELENRQYNGLKGKIIITLYILLSIFLTVFLAFLLRLENH
jgi:hypothetical protein